MGTVALAARCLVAVVFAVAAGTKLPNPASTRVTFREFGAPEPLLRLAGLLAPVELLLAAGLLIEPASRWAAIGAAALLIVFIAGMLNALRLRRRPDCGCFGGLRPAPIGRSTVARNALLLLSAVLVIVTGPGPSLNRWLSAHGAGAIAGGVILILAVAAALMFGLPSETPRTELSSPLDALRGPGIGSQAPDFTAAGVSEGTHSLGSLLAAGLPIVLLFVDAGCGDCLSLFADFARWQISLADRLSLVLIGSGDGDRLSQECERSGITVALLDTNRTVSGLYGSQATPSAMVVTAKGMIASGLAVGEDAIEDLVRLTLSRDQPIRETWTRTIPAA